MACLRRTGRHSIAPASRSTFRAGRWRSWTRLERVVARYDLRHARHPGVHHQPGRWRAMAAQRRRWPVDSRLGQPRPRRTHRVRRAAAPGADFRCRRRSDRVGSPVLGREVLVEHIEYGEGLDDDVSLNLRTRIAAAHDGAGVTKTEAYDFKGNLLRSSRQLARDYKGVPDWSSAVAARGAGLQDEHDLRRSQPSDQLDLARRHHPPPTVRRCGNALGDRGQPARRDQAGRAPLDAVCGRRRLQREARA